MADGRPELVEEIRAAPLEVREYLRMAVGAWLSDPQFREALPGHLPPDGASQARVPLVLGRLESIREISRSR